MNKRRAVLFFVALACFGLLFWLMAVDISGDRARPLLEVTVLVPAKNSEDYATIRQGIDRAADDLNVEVRFLTLTSRNDAYEQAALLLREVESGADGVLIAATDTSEALAAAVDEAARKIPVAAMESPIEGKRLSATIVADDHAMGFALGKEVLARTPQLVQATVLRSSVGNVAVDSRFRGFAYVLEQAGVRVDSIELADEMEQATTQVQAVMAENTSVVVALEKPVLEAAAQYAPLYTWVYGFGSSDIIASGLEEGRISATVVRNDFSIGYLGLQAVVDAINKLPPKSNPTINYRVVHRDNMYDDDVQKLLFPFVR